MKRMASAILLLAVILGLGVSLTGCGEETETVSAAAISALPPGKTFVIDLTHKNFWVRAPSTSSVTQVPTSAALPFARLRA